MNKLDGYKVGDRVRVTFEGEITSRDSDGDLWTDDEAMFSTSLQKRVVSVERIAKPVKVGDMVTWGTGAEKFKVVAIEDGNGILWSSKGYATDYPLSDLRHADATK